jgi:hypothetical protein
MPASVSDAGILFFAIPLRVVVDVFPVRKTSLQYRDPIQ